MEIKLNEIEVQKLNLQPGEVLIVKVKSDEITMASLEGLSEGIKSYFPNNKVAVLAIGENGAIDLTVVKESGNVESCATVCANCNCGKALKQNNEGNQ